MSIHTKIDRYTLDDNYRTYKRLFKMFKEDYPDLCIRGTTFEPYGYMEIRVYIPNKGKLIYNAVGVESGKIRWEERWTDPELERLYEKDKRPDMYQTFLSEIYIYQKETGASQEDIAKLSGVSRKSINRYLSGIVMPKTSTMRKICESLGIDI